MKLLKLEDKDFRITKSAGWLTAARVYTRTGNSFSIKTRAGWFFGKPRAGVLAR